VTNTAGGARGLAPPLPPPGYCYSKVYNSYGVQARMRHPLERGHRLKIARQGEMSWQPLGGESCTVSDNMVVTFSAWEYP